jgi:hypothetical protein
MYHLVNVNHSGMAVHLTSSDCEGSKVVDGTDDAMLWNDSEKDVDVRSECEEDEGTDCDDEGSNTNW